MLERLPLLWRRFSPLEERLLSAIRKALPEKAQPLFDAQVDAVTLVQRAPPSWTEVCLYRMRRGRADWSGVAMFPCTDEFRLAEVVFRSRGQRFKSVLTSISGHIFDFATTPGPKAIAFAPWDADVEARLLADPLHAPTGSREPEPIPAVWQRVLAEDPARWASGWVLHDAAAAYRLALDSGVHLVLAERDGEEFILQRLESEKECLLYMDQHDSPPEPLTTSVEALLARGAEAVGPDGRAHG
jgi:hypothetical protein